MAIDLFGERPAFSIAKTLEMAGLGQTRYFVPFKTAVTICAQVEDHGQVKWEVLLTDLVGEEYTTRDVNGNTIDIMMPTSIGFAYTHDFSDLGEAIVGGRRTMRNFISEEETVLKIGIVRSLLKRKGRVQPGVIKNELQCSDEFALSQLGALEVADWCDAGFEDGRGAWFYAYQQPRMARWI